MITTTIENTSIKILGNALGHLDKENLKIAEIHHFLFSIKQNAFTSIEFNYDAERKIFYVKEVEGQIFPNYYHFISTIENSIYSPLFDFDY